MKNEELLLVNEYLQNNDFLSIEKLLNKLDEQEEQKDYNYWLLRVLVARYKKDETALLNGIIGGMKACPTEFDMYNYLGDYYFSSNKDKAYLCYEMAEFYCHSEDKDILTAKKKQLLDGGEVSVKPVSIVIPSYNCMKMMQNCISSIRQTNSKDTYEIVVVDNASNDGIREWLQEQDDIVLIANEENVGFPVACNQGINAAKKENDIFLLNNDTIVPLNAIFWLRMGLYEDEKVGATGSVSNHVANDQMILETFPNVQGYIDWAYTNNVLSMNPYEKRLFLIGFALMMKRTVLDEVGLLDEAFSPGNYEDNDLGFRISKAGYRVLLCRNSFIYHFGSQSFKKDREAFEALLSKNKKYFDDKWEADFSLYMEANPDILNSIKDKRDREFSVLEIDCGVGATLSKLQYGYPNAAVKGIEKNKNVARVGSYYLDIISGDIEKQEMDCGGQSFDYVLIDNKMQCWSEPEKVLNKLKKYLKKGGKIIAGIPNVLNASIMAPLLQGRFEDVKACTGDKDSLRMFTRVDASKIFERAGYRIEAIRGVVKHDIMSSEDVEFCRRLSKMPGMIYEKEFEVYQYIFTVVND